MIKQSIWPTDGTLTGTTTPGSVDFQVMEIKEYSTFSKALGLTIRCSLVSYLEWLGVKYTGAGKYETLTTLRYSGTKRLLISWL